MVEPSFRPETEQQKCLYDFVDEQGVEELRGFFRECIDHTNDAQNALADATDEFDAELTAVVTTMTGKTDARYDHNLPSTASIFHSLEGHATEMATHLQALVRHYDLCMSALKHTEGGGEAAEQAIVDLPAGVEVGEIDPDVPPIPMSDDERADMIHVLENDAAEVDEVVQEIRDHAAEMEFQLEQIVNQLQMVESEYSSLSAAITSLVQLGQNLPEYIKASSTFTAQWSEQKSFILEKMEELENVGHFYESFVSAYDGLILEITRRKRAKETMEKVVDSAMSELRSLYKSRLHNLSSREKLTSQP